MNIRILDCTLRDGGYVNDWAFGETHIKGIISGLTAANLDIVECGFLANGSYDRDKSLFQSAAEIKMMLPGSSRHTKYVAMMNIGGYDLDQLEKCDRSSLWGIRVAFHEHQISEALEACLRIKEKG